MNLGRGLSQLRHLDVGFWRDRQRVLRGLDVDIDKAPITIGSFCDDSGDDTADAHQDDLPTILRPLHFANERGSQMINGDNISAVR